MRWWGIRGGGCGTASVRAMAAVTEGAHNSGAGVRGCAWRPLRDVLADCVGGSSEDGNSVASSFGLRDGLRQSGRTIRKIFSIGGAPHRDGRYRAFRDSLPCFRRPSRAPFCGEVPGISADRPAMTLTYSSRIERS